MSHCFHEVRLDSIFDHESKPPSKSLRWYNVASVNLSTKKCSKRDRKCNTLTTC